MGYRIRNVKSRNRAWKLLYCSRVGGVRKEHDIPVEQYHTLGFLPSMPLDAAKRHCSTINKNCKLKKDAEQKENIARRMALEDLQLNIQFPGHLIEEFESIFMRTDKDPFVWRSAKRLITSVSKDPEDWAYYKTLFYKGVKDGGYSYSYTQKLLYWVNQWGSFVCRRKKVYFEAIPNPRGVDRQRLVDQHTKSNGDTKATPLSPHELEQQSGKLRGDHFNWLYLSIWLGLRPHEIDQLKDSSTYRLSYGDVVVLWVYQPKLVGLPEDQRWKPIPLQCENQVHCVEIINSGEFKRPLNKTIRGVFGEGRKGYSGRKGFTDLMLSKGYSLEAISQWMGHTTLDRTWKDYKNKKKVLL